MVEQVRDASNFWHVSSSIVLSTAGYFHKVTSMHCACRIRTIKANMVSVSSEEKDFLNPCIRDVD